ncbi:MAG: hypothetical protein IPJ69_02230 [Deltaproteobacteria bacterium]|nr:MAG: hypothetical protein IPJ69_02230 [Deltaproteobacteria bacterium]
MEYADAHTKLKILLKEWLQYRKDTPVGLQNLLKRYLLSYPKASDSLTRWFLSIDGDRSEESLVDDFKDSSELHKVGIWALQHQNNQFFERVTRRFVVLNSMGKYEWIQFATAAISFGNHVAAATCLDRLESIPPNNLVSSFVGLFESCLKSNFLDLLPRVGALILKRSPSTREELSEKMDSFVESSNLTLEQAFICLVFYQEILGETPPPRVSQLIPIFHTGSCD